MAVKALTAERRTVDYFRANTTKGVSMMRIMTSVGIRQHPPVAARSSFLRRPCLVVGMPVALANLDLAPDIPKALFVENPFTL